MTERCGKSNVKREKTEEGETYGNKEESNVKGEEAEE